jgi:hypothetical protein
MIFWTQSEAFLRSDRIYNIFYYILQTIFLLYAVLLSYVHLLSNREIVMVVDANYYWSFYLTKIIKLYEKDREVSI